MENTMEIRQKIREAIGNGKITFREEYDSDGKFIGCYFGDRRFDWYLESFMEILEDDIEAVIDDMMDKLWFMDSENFKYCMEVIR